MSANPAPSLCRRQLLAGGTGLATSGLLAGCLSIFRDQEVQLAYVNISGSQDEAVEVELEIEWESERVYEGRASVSHGESYDLVDHWPDEAGTWTVSARTTGDEWVSLDSVDADENQTAVRGFLGRAEPYSLSGLEFSQTHID